MKTFALVSVALLSVVASTVAVAQTAADKKWVAQCLVDNKDAKVAASVVNAYCVCMNDQMSENETKSITQWEKENPAERKMCEAKAGW